MDPYLRVNALVVPVAVDSGAPEYDQGVDRSRAASGRLRSTRRSGPAKRVLPIQTVFMAQARAEALIAELLKATVTCDGRAIGPTPATAAMEAELQPSRRIGALLALSFTLYAV